MSNGKCSEAEDKILGNHDVFVAEPTLDGKVQKLGENFRDGRLDTVRQFAQLYHRLPWRPWMLTIMASIGVLGIAGAIWATSAFNTNVQTRIEQNKGSAAEAKQTASDAHVKAEQVREDLTQQLKPVSDATVAANAKLDMLLEAKGMSAPSRSRLRKSAVALGLTPDSTNQDSPPSGPH